MRLLRSHLWRVLKRHGAMPRNRCCESGVRGLANHTATPCDNCCRIMLLSKSSSIRTNMVRVGHLHQGRWWRRWQKSYHVYAPTKTIACFSVTHTSFWTIPNCMPNYCKNASSQIHYTHNKLIHRIFTKCSHDPCQVGGRCGCTAGGGVHSIARHWKDDPSGNAGNVVPHRIGWVPTTPTATVENVGGNGSRKGRNGTVKCTRTTTQ